MSILIFSSDRSFGDFLSQSLHENGLKAHQAISFSDAELKLYKSEPDIAIFVDLDESELRKIGRAVGEGCSVLVIGDTNQRSLIKAHWRFLTTQSSVTAVLAAITDFFFDLNNVSFSLGQHSSYSLEEHFSTAASVDPLKSDVVGSFEKKKLAIYGLSASEIQTLSADYNIVEGFEIPFCDSVVLRPDNSQQCLEFLAASQSVLPTALVSFGSSNFFKILACSVVSLNSDATLPEINEAINATYRENGPCYDASLPEKQRAELNRLGCRAGSPHDFLTFDPLNSPFVEQVNIASKTTIPNALNLNTGSDFDKRRGLWLVAARTRSGEKRNIQHLPDLVRGLAKLKSPCLLSISTERTDSRQFISNMLRDIVPFVVNSKAKVLCVCESCDLEYVEGELESLQRWTGRDTRGLGWFPRIQTEVFKVEPHTIAPILAGIEEARGTSSKFELIRSTHDKIKQ